MDENYKQPIPTVPVSSTPANEEEIDLTELLGKLWHKRKFILKLTGIFLLVGLFIALFSPVEYTAQCTVVPQTGEEDSKGGLGSLAAMAGINVGSIGAGGTISPTIYPEIVKSVTFTRDIMQTSVTVKKSEGKPITLYEYYTDKKYGSFNVVNVLKKYTIGLPGVILSAVMPAEDSLLTAAGDSTALPVMSKEEKEVYDIIQGSLKLELAQKDGYVTIGYTFPEAEGAAQITDGLRRTLERYVIGYKTEKAKADLAFVEQSYEDAKKDFIQKQTNLAAFVDANRGLASAMARATEERLRNEYNIAFTVYNELAKQREQAQLAVRKTTPVLTVVNPVVVPAEKSAPRRGLILVVFVFLGLIVAIGWVFAAPLFKNLSQEVKQQPTDA
jgi:uncharacterized protein involved in exopolysaccharide biosynthesis